MKPNKLNRPASPTTLHTCTPLPSYLAAAKHRQATYQFIIFGLPGFVCPRCLLAIYRPERYMERDGALMSTNIATAPLHNLSKNIQSGLGAQHAGSRHTLCASELPIAKWLPTLFGARPPAQTCSTTSRKGGTQLGVSFLFETFVIYIHVYTS